LGQIQESQLVTNFYPSLRAGAKSLHDDGLKSHNAGLSASLKLYYFKWIERFEIDKAVISAFSGIRYETDFKGKPYA